MAVLQTRFVTQAHLGMATAPGTAPTAKKLGWKDSHYAPSSTHTAPPTPPWRITPYLSKLISEQASLEQPSETTESVLRYAEEKLEAGNATDALVDLRDSTEAALRNGDMKRAAALCDGAMAIFNGEYPHSAMWLQASHFAPYLRALGMEEESRALFTLIVGGIPAIRNKHERNQIRSTAISALLKATMDFEGAYALAQTFEDQEARFIAYQPIALALHEAGYADLAEKCIMEGCVQTALEPSRYANNGLTKFLRLITAAELLVKIGSTETAKDLLISKLFDPEGGLTLRGEGEQRLSFKAAKLLRSIGYEFEAAEFFTNQIMSPGWYTSRGVSTPEEIRQVTIDFARRRWPQAFRGLILSIKKKPKKLK